MLPTAIKNGTRFIPNKPCCKIVCARTTPKKILLIPIATMRNLFFSVDDASVILPKTRPNNNHESKFIPIIIERRNKNHSKKE